VPLKPGGTALEPEVTGLASLASLASLKMEGKKVSNCLQHPELLTMGSIPIPIPALRIDISTIGSIRSVQYSLMWASLSTAVHAKVDVVEVRLELASNKAARLAWFARRVPSCSGTASP
jgi:hypothetical protein